MGISNRICELWSPLQYWIKFQNQQLELQEEQKAVHKQAEASAKPSSPGGDEAALHTPVRSTDGAPEATAADAKSRKPPQEDHNAWMAKLEATMSNSGVDDMLLAGADAKQLLKVQAICNAQKEPVEFFTSTCRSPPGHWSMADCGVHKHTKMMSGTKTRPCFVQSGCVRLWAQWIAGWFFGTCFFHILGIVTPTD